MRVCLPAWIRAPYRVGVARRFLVVLLLAAGAASSGWAASAPLVVQGDSAVGGLRIGRSGTAAATARFGPASTTRSRPPYECVRSWRRIGLTLSFLDLSNGSACRSGALVTATITSRAAWRTALGLRVGDPVARVQRLYPRARFRRGGSNWTGYWLITRHACTEVGGSAFPGLLARIRAGRVSAIVAGTTACE
jgi:hypothetical protein